MWMGLVFFPHVVSVTRDSLSGIAELSVLEIRISKKFWENCEVRRLITYSLIIQSCLDPFAPLLSNRNANHLIVNSFSLFLYLYIGYFLFFIFLPSLKFYNASYQFKWYLLWWKLSGPLWQKELFSTPGSQYWIIYCNA